MIEKLKEYSQIKFQLNTNLQYTVSSRDPNLTNQSFNKQTNKKKITLSPVKILLVFLDIQSTAKINRSGVIYTDRTEYSCLSDLYLLSLFSYLKL